MSKRTEKKPKRSYNTYDPEKLILAVQAVKNKELSLRKAAKNFQISVSTLHDHFHGTHVKAVGHPAVLLHDEEKLLVEAAQLLAEYGLPVSRLDYRRLAKGYFDQIGRKTHFPSNMPSKKWLRCFLMRWKAELSVRIPESLASNRAKALTKEVISEFFKKYEKILVEKLLTTKPNCIWNCDETGFGTDPKNDRVIAKRGAKNVNLLTGNALRLNYTLCYAVEML